MTDEALKDLHPIVRSVIEAKREFGLTIHYPNMGEKLDMPRIEYVQTLLDAVILLRQEELKQRKEPELFGVPQLFIEFYKDEDRAVQTWWHICHKVSECPDDVLEYCEEVLRQAGKPVPKRPSTKVLLLEAAE